MPRNSKPNKEGKSPRPCEEMRREIAAMAARIMAEDGVGDYAHAKRKAARRLGLSEGEEQPSNQEIEVALRAYQSLYQDEELRDRLTELRRCALEHMRALEQFHPYLTGAVLDGTAGRYAEVELELFADSAKDVEIFLLDHGLNFEHAETTSRNGGQHGVYRPEARLYLDSEVATLLLTIYPYNLERMHRRSPHTGQVAARANADTVAALLEAE